MVQPKRKEKLVGGKPTIVQAKGQPLSGGRWGSDPGEETQEATLSSKKTKKHNYKNLDTQPPGGGRSGYTSERDEKP